MKTQIEVKLVLQKVNIESTALFKLIRRVPFQYLQHRVVGEGATPSPGLLHFTLDHYLSVNQGDIKYYFFESGMVFGMTRPEIEPRSPGS